jgi:hypothetical protein
VLGADPINVWSADNPITVCGADLISVCETDDFITARIKYVVEVHLSVSSSHTAYAAQPLGGSSHKSGDAAFTPSRLTGLEKANTESSNSYNIQHARAKQNTLFFKQKDTQPSQACFGGHITPNQQKIDPGDPLR